jgi:hypothetical protein
MHSTVTAGGGRLRLALAFRAPRTCSSSQPRLRCVITSRTRRTTLQSKQLIGCHDMTWPNQGAANRRPAGQSGGSDNLSATVAADRAFPAAVAELDVGRLCTFATRYD